jgi:hypothetical protein
MVAVLDAGTSTLSARMTTLDPESLAAFSSISSATDSILSHILSQSSQKKAHEVLPLPLLEHFLDLICHVRLVDERIGELEGQTEEQREERTSKLETFLAYTIVLRVSVSRMYSVLCFCLLMPEFNSHSSAHQP